MPQHMQKVLYEILKCGLFILWIQNTFCTIVCFSFCMSVFNKCAKEQTEGENMKNLVIYGWFRGRLGGVE